MTIPTVLRLRIARFRGIKELDWHPAPGLILGGGDVGKTTILDAICMLLSPVTPIWQFVILPAEPYIAGSPRRKPCLTSESRLIDDEDRVFIHSLHAMETY